MAKVEIIGLGLNSLAVTDEVTAEQKALELAKELGFKLSKSELNQITEPYKNKEPKTTDTAPKKQKQNKTTQQTK